VVELTPMPVRYRRAQLVWPVAWLAITLVALLLKPSPKGFGTHQQLGLAPCPSVLIFGRPCPGCGLTTSFTATVHGQLENAFVAHPLGTLLYIMFTVGSLGAAWAFFRGQRMQISTAGYRVLWGVIGIYMAYGVFRFVVPPEHYSGSFLSGLRGSKQARGAASVPEHDRSVHLAGSNQFK
jgi:hypothetical protein